MSVGQKRGKIDVTLLLLEEDIRVVPAAQQALSRMNILRRSLQQTRVVQVSILVLITKLHTQQQQNYISAFMLRLQLCLIGPYRVRQHIQI